MVAAARALNPRIEIVLCASTEDEAAILRAATASEVLHAEQALAGAMADLAIVAVRRSRPPGYGS
jgi:hypothetical protein